MNPELLGDKNDIKSVTSRWISADADGAYTPRLSPKDPYENVNDVFAGMAVWTLNVNTEEDWDMLQNTDAPLTNVAHAEETT